MCEVSARKIVFSQCRFIDPGNRRIADSTDFHFSETPHYVYVELRKYDSDLYILETWLTINGEDMHTRELLPLRTRSYDAIRIAIIKYDMYAKKINALAEEGE